MNWNEIKLNIFAPLAILFTLWLGFSGKVDWWVILLLMAWEVDISITLRKK